MSEQGSEIFSGLPQTRPQRRSSRRPPAAPAAESAPGSRVSAEGAPAPSRTARVARTAARPQRQRIAQPAQPMATPKPSGLRPPKPASEEHDALGRTVRAAAEVVEVGLAIGTHALRRALSRLPRP
jgi:hypothetical protein